MSDKEKQIKDIRKKIDKAISSKYIINSNLLGGNTKIYNNKLQKLYNQLMLLNEDLNKMYNNHFSDMNINEADRELLKFSNLVFNKTVSSFNTFKTYDKEIIKKMLKEPNSTKRTKISLVSKYIAEIKAMVEVFWDDTKRINYLYNREIEEFLETSNEKLFIRNINFHNEINDLGLKSLEEVNLKPFIWFLKNANELETIFFNIDFVKNFDLKLFQLKDAKRLAKDEDLEVKIDIENKLILLFMEWEAYTEELDFKYKHIDVYQNRYINLVIQKAFKEIDNELNELENILSQFLKQQQDNFSFVKNFKKKMI